MFQLSLESEFKAVVAMHVFDHEVERLRQYNKELDAIDVPEFAKLAEDKIITKADKYVTRLIREGKLFQAYLEIF